VEFAGSESGDISTVREKSQILVVFLAIIFLKLPISESAYGEKDITHDHRNVVHPMENAADTSIITVYTPEIVKFRISYYFTCH